MKKIDKQFIYFVAIVKCDSGLSYNEAKEMYGEEYKRWKKHKKQ